MTAIRAPCPRWSAAAKRADGTFSLVITPENAGWGYSSLRILELPPAAAPRSRPARTRCACSRSAGGCVVECACDGTSGSSSPGGPACSPGSPTSPTSRGTPRSPCPRPAGGRFALPAARATRRLPARYGPAEDVPVELRGAGQASRQVNNFCTPATFEADKLIAVEVLTPVVELVLVPAAQARRGSARASRSWRRSTTSRSTRHLGPPGRLPAGVHLGPGPGDRRVRRGAHRRHRAHPARLARPVDGRARLPPLLPERDGRPQPGPRRG